MRGDAVGGICALAGVLATTVGWYSLGAALSCPDLRTVVPSLTLLGRPIAFVLGLDPGTRSMRTMSYVGAAPGRPTLVHLAQERRRHGLLP
jgi:hypothetical protein